ncbi:unnamed protein product [Phytomonas sp. Hart1]|nr:unnamed protein product [Phytomonas sp. Hart1]|eukprot:CCW68944.1 unnamed protein product [Phytomonas sp. isolate Hart1]
MRESHYGSVKNTPDACHNISSPTVRFHSPKTREAIQPKAVLSTLTLFGVMYVSTISGCYGMENSVRSGGPLLSIIFFLLIPLVWGVPVSICVAELSCAIPSNAGPVMWVNCAFQPWVTFTTILWTTFLSTVDNSLYPEILADYCAMLFDIDSVTKTWVKIGFLSLCMVVNIVGFRLLGPLSVFIVIITLVPFVLMFALQLPHGLNWERIGYVPETINWALFLPVVAWNFSGFEAVGNVIEEVKNPKSAYIRALVLMILASFLTYIPPILAGASVQGLEKVPFENWDNGFWVKVGAAVGGTPLAATVLIGGAMSMFGLMTTLIATTSRALTGIAAINAFPTFISNWLQKYSMTFNAHVNAIVLNTMLTGTLSIFFSFQTLVQIDQVLYALRLITILLTFLKLRISQPLLERPYRAPGGKFAACLWAGVPICFSLFLVVMTVGVSPFIFYTSALLIFGSILISVVIVNFFKCDGFEGSLVEAYEDPDIQAYESFLGIESEQWRKHHSTSIFIEHPNQICLERFVNII